MKPGLGLAWRKETAWLLSQREDLALTEVVAENLLSNRSRDIKVPPALRALRRTRPDLPIVPHGISLSLGSAEGIDDEHLARLGALAEHLDAPMVSEHLAYVRAGGVEIGHLTPVARTEKMLEIVVQNIEKAQRVLPVPLALENIAPLFSWPENEIREATFLRRIVEATGVQLVLDVANLHASAVNEGVDALAYLDELPLEAVAYVHVAGGRLCGGLYHDTHADSLAEDVLSLLGQLLARRADLAVLLEHDHGFPPHGGIARELARIADVILDPPSREESSCIPSTQRVHLADTDVALRQAALADSLTTVSPAPAGFDAARIGGAQRSLRAKKQRETSSLPKKLPGLRGWLSRVRRGP